MRNRFVLLAVLFLAFGGTAHGAGDDASDFPYIPFDHPAIRYVDQKSDDAITRLEQQIERGEANLAYDAKWGFLPDLLKRLSINVDSQILVFSKTSFQAPRISPAKPRAVYFNDQAAVGYVQGGPVMEVISFDRRQGPIFYTLDTAKSDKPSFHRQDMACLQCHVNPGTLNVPGILISSVHPGADGSVYLQAGSYVTDHRSPIEERWGGWYVTGLHGSIEHRGNSFVRSSAPDEFESQAGQNVTSLENRFDTSAYLAASSDIVALMTIEHQTRMANLMTRAGWESRVADHEGKQKEFQDRLRFLTDEIAAYMLFADEAPIREPISGTSTFTETFPKRGPCDKQGRSLRDFDLKKRLFRYPLSYMLYSEEFDAMPDVIRESVYRKLYDVLTGADKSPRFARLSAADRAAILEIVRDTKPGLPAYWQAASKAD